MSAFLLAYSALEANEHREEDKDAKARRTVRTNNFTQQTNALDVDKHMYVYSGLACSIANNQPHLGWLILRRT